MAPGYIWWIGAMTLNSFTPPWVAILAGLVLRHSDYTLLLSSSHFRVYIEMAPGYIWWIGAMTSLEPLLHPTLGRYPRWTHVLRHSDYTLLLSRVGLMRLEIINLMFGAVGTVDVWVNLNQHRDSWNVSFALSFHMNVEIGGNSIPQSYLWRNYFTLHTSEYILKWLQDIYDELEPWRHWSHSFTPPWVAILAGLMSCVTQTIRSF